jgi:hypothetical protein
MTGLTSDGEPIKNNHLACLVRKDFMTQFPTVSKKETDQIMYTVLGHLMQLAKEELKKK